MKKTRGSKISLDCPFKRALFLCTPTVSRYIAVGLLSFRLISLSSFCHSDLYCWWVPTFKYISLSGSVIQIYIAVRFQYINLYCCRVLSFRYRCRDSVIHIYIAVGILSFRFILLSGFCHSDLYRCRDSVIQIYIAVGILSFRFISLSGFCHSDLYCCRVPSLSGLYTVVHDFMCMSWRFCKTFRSCKHICEISVLALTCDTIL